MQSAQDNDKLESDLDLIEDDTAKDHEAFEAFKKAMEGRHYGSSALNTAWAWFKAGWEASDESWRA